MNKLRNQLILTTTAVLMGVLVWMADDETAAAMEKAGYDFPNAGIAAVLSPSSYGDGVGSSVGTEEDQLNISEKIEKERERMLTEIAMANVSNTLNVRADASEDADKVGYLYRDCGGTILEQKNGWTKISSGGLTGWCSDEFLLFGQDAVEMAEDVGNWIVKMDSEAVRVRKEPSTEAETLALLVKTDYADFIDTVNTDWISIDYEGDVAYLDANYVNVTFHIDEGETIEHVKAREKIEEQLRKEAEEKAKAEAKDNAKKNAQDAATKKIGNLTSNRGAMSADADEIRLLAALIYCEAGNQSYEGKVGVGAVVMNRVKSPAYPNSIYSVIYASGQFTPAMSGKVATVYERGAPDSCVQAAVAAINGETTVGDATHFRSSSTHAGYVLGSHVFW